MPSARAKSQAPSSARLNRARLADHVRCFPGRDRFEISKSLALSPSLTHLYLNELQASGWLRALPKDAKRAGRKSDAWLVNAARLKFLTFSAGISGGAWEERDLAGTVTRSGEFAFGGIRSQIDFIREIETAAARPDLFGSGTALSCIVLDGPVNPDHGFVYGIDGLPEWTPLSMQNILGHVMVRPPLVVSRVTAFLHSLSACGQGGDFVFFKLDGNPAFGTCEKGRILKGGIGTAGELSHRRFDERGAACFCGGRGCLESTGDPAERWRLIRERALEGIVKSYRPSKILVSGISGVDSAIPGLPVEVLQPGTGDILAGGWHLAAEHAINLHVE